MREPPAHLGDAEVLEAVRRHWDDGVGAVEPLPVGFGAHHWVTRTGGRPRLFVTLDALGRRHTADTLEATYAAAAALADGGLDFVVPTLATTQRRRTVPLADGTISATPWLEGEAGTGVFRDRAEAEATAAMLAALHATPAPPGIRSWSPLVPRGFAAELALELGRPWATGPYGERAHALLAERIEDVGRWVTAYHRLAHDAEARRWVPTHGEPDTGNQLRTDHGPVLVDWESLRLAPAERDLRTLTGSDYADLCRPDWAMVELFDLEWRLDEIAAYALWVSAPHAGTRSDEVAFGGLRAELDRAEWQQPG